MSKIESFSYNLLYHYSSLLMNIITGIFMVPLYLKFIDLNIYGYWIAISGIISFLSLVDPGIGTVVQQKISEAYIQKKTQIGEYILSGLIITTGISTLILIILFVFGSLILDHSQINKILFYNELLYPFLLALLSMIIMLYGYIYSSANIAIFNTKNTTKLNLITTILTLVLSIILLYNNFKLYAIALTMLIRAIIFTFSNYYYFNKRLVNLETKYSNKKTLELLNFSSYSFLGRLSSTVTLQFATMIVTFYISPKLAVAMKMTQIIPETMKMIFDRPTYALTPLLISTYKINPVNLFLKKFINLYLKSLVFLGTIYFLFFYAFNEIIISFWVGNKFAGNNFNFLFLLYLFFSTLNQTSNYLIYGFGDQKKSNIILLLQSIIFVILIFLLTKYFSLVGVAAAYLISEVFISFLYAPFKLLKQVGSSKLEIKYLLKYIFYTISYIVIYAFLLNYYKIFFNSISETIFYFLIGILVYILTVYIFSTEFKSIFRFIKHNGLINTVERVKSKILI